MTTKAQKEPKKITRNKVTVAEYLTAQIDLCGKTQKDIARECGFEKPNIITMLKQGTSKLPISRVGVMAKALGVDPLYLFQLAMNEYEPETWASIEELILRQPFVSQNEMDIIQLVRQANVVNPKVRTIEEKERILSAINKLRPDNAAATD
jgi:transcriptional regulator with XRE-family HTH domain